MSQKGDYFVCLGLVPGVYSEQQLADRLADIREARPGQDRLADATLAYCVLRDSDRQRRYLSRLLVGRATLRRGRDADRPDEAGPSSADDGDLEAAFSASVAGLLEGDSGVLRYSNRRRLLDLAARLGINPFEANLLIERARFRATHRPAWPTDQLPPDQPVPLPTHPSSRAVRWLIAIGLALLADVVLLAVLLRG